MLAAGSARCAHTLRVCGSRPDGRRAVHRPRAGLRRRGAGAEKGAADPPAAVPRRRLAALVPGAAVVVALPARRALAEQWELAAPTPAGLRPVEVSGAAREMLGVRLSLKDVDDPSVTLAVFAVPATAPDTASAFGGSARTFAASRAASAPRQTSLAHRTRKAGAVTVFEAETEVGGGTAGRFGSAVELVAVAVDRGTQYEVRATASAAAWPKRRSELRRCVSSLRFP